MKNKRALADFILKETLIRGSNRDQRDGPFRLSKEALVDVLVKFEEQEESK